MENGRESVISEHSRQESPSGNLVYARRAIAFQYNPDVCNMFRVGMKWAQYEFGRLDIRMSSKNYGAVTNLVGATRKVRMQLYDYLLRTDES